MGSVESAVQLRELDAIAITPDSFARFGQVIFPSDDGTSFGPDDAHLKLDGGTPRFYIMRLDTRGTEFDRITRHQACTQCLGSLEGRDWLMAVAPPGETEQPDPQDIRAFRIPGTCFIKLHVGTWHAGPYFEGDPISFYNLELSDTNIVDHDTCNLAKAYGLRFKM